MYLNTDNRGQEATSSDTHRKVDAEVTRMLRKAYSRVTSLLVRLLNFSNGGKWQSSLLITLYHTLQYLLLLLLSLYCQLFTLRYCINKAWMMMAWFICVPPLCHSPCCYIHCSCYTISFIVAACPNIEFASQQQCGKHAADLEGVAPLPSIGIDCSVCDADMGIDSLQTERESELHTLARTLLEHETLTRDEIQQVLDGTFSKVPVAREAAEAEVEELLAGHVHDHAHDTTHSRH